MIRFGFLANIAIRAEFQRWFFYGLWTFHCFVTSFVVTFITSLVPSWCSDNSFKTFTRANAWNEFWNYRILHILVKSVYANSNKKRKFYIFVTKWNMMLQRWISNSNKSQPLLSNCLTFLCQCLKNIWKIDKEIVHVFFHIFTISTTLLNMKAWLRTPEAEN